MLTALTALAMIALAIHTKTIYASAMEEMLAESGRQAAGQRDALASSARPPLE